MSVDNTIKASKASSFTHHPNSAIHTDIANSPFVLGPINSLTDGDEESADFSFETFKSQIPFTVINNIVSSDLALNGELIADRSISSSSDSTDLTISQDGSLLLNKDGNHQTPLFSENFEIVKNSTTIYATDVDSQTGGDVLSLISGTTISQLLNLDTIATESNISSAIKKAEIGKSISVKDDISSKINRGSMLQEVEFMNVGSSKILENNEVKVESIEPLKENDKQVMDVKSVVMSSKGVAQLFFISMIKFAKGSPVKFVTAKQLEKQIDDEVQRVFYIKYQMNAFSSIKSFFTQRKSGEDQFYKKAVHSLFKKLTIIYSNQKLYYDVNQRGMTPIDVYKFRTWRHDEYVGVNDSRYGRVLKGDGWHSTWLPPFHDFKIITNRSSFSWSRDLFKPIVVFPKLRFLVKNEDPDTLVNYYGLLLNVLDSQVFESKKLKYKSLNASNLGEVLASRPTGNIKKLSKIIWIELREYVYNHHECIQYRRSDILGVEEPIKEKFVKIVDCAINGYIEAFNYLDGFSTLSKHGSNEIYVKIFEFYKNCPIVDLGFYLLQDCTPEILDRRLFKLRLEGKTGLEILEIVIQKNLSKLDSMTLGFLRLMVAFIGSPYITKFILRRLMYWGDNVAMDPLTYVQNFNWFKDPQDFYQLISTTVRDDAVSFIEKRMIHHN